jgi:nucleotide-binding universal stress UspA family protein
LRCSIKFKDILVHIDNSPQCGSRVQLAVALAREHDASLTGLYVVTHPPYAPRGEKMKSDQIKAQEMFARATASADIRAEWFAADWGTVGISMVEVINFYAHTKDLVIVGQTDPSVQPWDVPADLPQQVVVGAGRPVLVVPYSGTFKSAGRRAVVAWKAGRVSARAVNDALPFLLGSEEVFVLSITAPGEQKKEGTGNHGSLRVNLERHGIGVKEESIAMSTIPVANLLMTYAWEHSCDLIVMGVLVQTTRGKYDLGPVAKGFFDSMTLPVLMSH